MKWLSSLIPDNPISQALSGINNLKGDDRFVNFIENDLGLGWDQLNKANALKMIGSDDAKWLMNQPEGMPYSDRVNRYMDIVGNYNLVDESARSGMKEGLLNLGNTAFEDSTAHFKNVYQGG
tara:strand:- start:26 stop:391 length:366 start_codon:yes stop_codon:yes gene_type:complete